MQFTGELYAHHLIRTCFRDRPEGWELASGAWSPFYLMFREVPSYPHLFRYSVQVLAQLTAKMQQESRVDILVGIATTGIPLAAGVALDQSLPLAFTRKVAGVRKAEDLQQAAQAWGQHALVEGVFREGAHYLLVDDVVTGAASKELAREQVEAEAARRGVQVEFAGTVVVIDRGYPQLDAAALQIKAGHRLYDELDQILAYGGTQREVGIIRQYLEDPAPFQDPGQRQRLLANA